MVSRPKRLVLNHSIPALEASVSIVLPVIVDCSG